MSASAVMHGEITTPNDGLSPEDRILQKKEAEKKAKEEAKEAEKRAKEEAKAEAKRKKEEEKAAKKAAKEEKKSKKNLVAEGQDAGAAGAAAGTASPEKAAEGGEAAAAGGEAAAEPEISPEEQARLDAEAEAAAAEAKRLKEMETRRKNFFKALTDQKVTPLDLDPEAYSQTLKNAIQEDVAELGPMAVAEIEAAQDRLRKSKELREKFKAQSEALARAAAPLALDIDEEKLKSAIDEANGKVDQELKLAQALQMATVCAAIAKAVDCPEAEFSTAIQALEDGGAPEKVLAPLKKKRDEVKAKIEKEVVAAKKSKKPAPKPAPAPELPPMSAEIAKNKEAYDGACKEATFKLKQAKAAHALLAAQQAPLLELDDDALQAAIGAAEGAKVDDAQVRAGKEKLAQSLQAKQEDRTAKATAALHALSKPPPLEVDKDALGAAIETGGKELVDVFVVDAAKQALYVAYKRCAEEALRPLNEPSAADEVHVIEPLEKALAEAKKRGSVEELLIMGDVKLAFWKDARDRRVAAKKALEDLCKPVPVRVEIGAVEAAIAEGVAAKVSLGQVGDKEPTTTIEDSRQKLQIAKATQSLWDAHLPDIHEIDIPRLQAELDSVGGAHLAEAEAIEAELQRAYDRAKLGLDTLLENNDKEKEMRSSLALKKQGNLKQRDAAAPSSNPDEAHLQALFARTRRLIGDVDSGGGAAAERGGGEEGAAHSPPSAAQIRGVLHRELDESTKMAKEKLEAQQAVVSAMRDEGVPKDLVHKAQAKLAAARAYVAMVDVSGGEPLQVNVKGLESAISRARRLTAEALAVAVKDLPKSVKKKDYEERSAVLPEWVLKVYESIKRNGERAQRERARLAHLLELRLDQDDVTLSFAAVTRIVREARTAGVDRELIAKAELRLAEIAPEIRLFGVRGLCDGCSAIREALLHRYIIPKATGAVDEQMANQPTPEPMTPVGALLSPLLDEMRAAMAKCAGGGKQGVRAPR